MINKYAKIENNLVVNVILCEDLVINELDGNYIKVTESTKEAHIGAEWNDTNNIFIPVSPWPSWVLNESFIWESPKGPNPDPLTKKWDEENQDWVNR